jgi:prophage DNA circulation protein
MRDWTKTLRKASFRGVPFQVESEGLAGGGRHIAVHEYVRSEDIQTEDMGRKANRYRVTAYIANDLADVQGAALVAALTAPGVGILMLPMLGPLEVRISGDISTNHSRDQLGYVGFDFEAVEAGSGSLFPSLPLGNRLAAAAAASIAGLARTFLGGFRP